MVERLVWDQEVGGSNPLTPIHPSVVVNTHGRHDQRLTNGPGRIEIDGMPLCKSVAQRNMEFDTQMVDVSRLPVRTKAFEKGSDDSRVRKATPFVKWAGGKRSLIDKLKNRLPQKFDAYFEPFVGGGALFFELCPHLNQANLSDANVDLMTTYRVIQTRPDELLASLHGHAARHSREDFYAARAIHGISDPVELASRLLYLNKTCFNGLWRVNKKGEFNVPFGRNLNPGIVQTENILACNRALQGVRLTFGDYRNIAPNAGDFVYFDPPYHPTSETSFTAYAQRGFSEKDQEMLSKFAFELHRNGVLVMLSNSNTPFIRKLYKSKHFNIEVVEAPRMVNCKPGGRGVVEEVLITNY